MVDDDFDWQEYYDTHPEYRECVDILMDPADDYKYAPKPLHEQIKDITGTVLSKIKRFIFKSDKE